MAPDSHDPYELCRYCSIRPCRCPPGREAEISRDVAEMDVRYAGWRVAEESRGSQNDAEVDEHLPRTGKDWSGK